MSGERKQPGVAFWITVALVAVLVGYPLSWGPWSWLSYVIDMPKPITTVGMAFFRPCKDFYISGPEPIRSWYQGYINPWARDGYRRSL